MYAYSAYVRRISVTATKAAPKSVRILVAESKEGSDDSALLDIRNALRTPVLQLARRVTTMKVSAPAAKALSAGVVSFLLLWLTEANRVAGGKSLTARHLWHASIALGIGGIQSDVTQRHRDWTSQNRVGPSKRERMAVISAVSKSIKDAGDEDSKLSPLEMLQKIAEEKKEQLQAFDQGAVGNPADGDDDDEDNDDEVDCSKDKRSGKSPWSKDKPIVPYSYVKKIHQITLRRGNFSSGASSKVRKYVASTADELCRRVGAMAAKCAKEEGAQSILVSHVYRALQREPTFNFLCDPVRETMNDFLPEVESVEG